jgi:Tol biopolymer transport system component
MKNPHAFLSACGAFHSSVRGDEDIPELAEFYASATPVVTLRWSPMRETNLFGSASEYPNNTSRIVASGCNAPSWEYNGARMGLPSGTKLGPYEIQSPLGAGGMGEVYRARDTRLDRTVAVKILPSHLSDKPDAKQRFDREARAISSLNHPNICTLYDVGQQDGMDFLVMEFLEGETLADRLMKGPLPPEHVLKYGAEICEGLEKAHRSGVVHRDLKPGNIMLTKTGAKLMDFGLAKETMSPSLDASALTAMDGEQPLTEVGTIVGTFQYMSPEQLQGHEADARSDIFALGAVLYEMITGKRAFPGKTKISVASAILEKDPEPISANRPMSPPALDRVVKSCLAKDPDDRWQTAHDVKLQLKHIVDGGSQAGEAARVPAGRRRRERASWLLAASLFLLLLAAGVALWSARNQRLRPMYFHLAVPFPANDLALSQDGRMLAMVAYSAQASGNVLWTYEIGGRQTSSLNGTQGASYPFWSPDARFIGFFADGKLKKVDMSDGQVQVLCDAPNGRGGTWNRDGVIVFSPDAIGTIGLSRVSSQGGPPAEMTKPDTSRFETSHRWPVFLPDGKHFLYLAANFTGHPENNAIFLGSLDSQERRQIVNTSANAAYAEPGYLLYLRDQILVAQPFDHRRYILSGEPHTVSDEVLYFPQVDRAVFSVSSGEVLVTQTGKGASLSQLTWFDRSGKPTGTVGTPGSYHNIRLSPDGRRIATDQTDPDGRNIDIWAHEPARGMTTRLTFDPALDYGPVWSPDGKQILFGSSRRLAFRLYLKNADGSGPEKEVVDLGVEWQLVVWDWSSDSKDVLLRKGSELWYITWPERIAKPLLQAKWTVRNAQFSPDGRWMAYASNETGSWEIYVSPFPSANGKWQVSSAGGQEPRWRRDGKELFYLSAEGKMMAVAVTAGASFAAGSPVALFQTHRRQPISSTDVFSYDVSGDGQRFLVNTKVDEAKSAPLSVLLNWNSAMKK